MGATMLREIAADDTAFRAALAASHLPTEDLTDAPYRYFAYGDGAWGGLGEGEDALLRSVVVNADVRGRGIGADLVAALVDVARRSRTKRLWLLTTNAAPFFARQGWAEAQRDDAPDAIARSAQFASLCPASAALMVRAL